MADGCFKSAVTGEKRLIPLTNPSRSNLEADVAALGLDITELASAELSGADLAEERFIAILQVADVKDNGSREPNAFRLAYFKPDHTEAHYNNSSATMTLMRVLAVRGC